MSRRCATAAACLALLLAQAPGPARAQQATAPAARASTPAAAPTPAATPLRIPVVEGLIVTTAVAEPTGDYESRKQLLRRDGDAWIVAYATSLPAPGGGPVRRVSSERRLHLGDLATATAYRAAFEDGVQEDYPGTTALGTSRAVLEALRTQGSTPFSLQGDARWLEAAMAKPPAAKPGLEAGVAALAGGLLGGAQLSFKGTLRRIRRGSLPVLVNGRSVRVPALVAAGRLVNRKQQALDVALTFVDDPANPLALDWRVGTASLRTVRIEWPRPKASSALAATLARDKRVALPGLYFDFGSAVLRPESQAALPAIADAVRSAPPGVLALEGHTDAIGNPRANLALSSARADAVRSALVSLDAKLASRLQARGFGEDRPVADNATLEGRARNRRVELVLP